MAGFYHSMLGSMGCTSSSGAFNAPSNENSQPGFAVVDQEHAGLKRRIRLPNQRRLQRRMAHVTIDRTVLPWRPWDVGLAKSGVGKLLYGILANEPRRGGYGAVGRERCEGVIHFVEDGNVKVAEVAWPWHKACLRQSACNNRREAVEDEIPSALPAS